MSIKSLQLDKNITGTLDTIDEVLPTGWSKFKDIILRASELCGTEITGLDRKNGILYVSSRGDNHDIFHLVARALMGDSAKTCMVCGGFGRRRKIEEGSPSLCRVHYFDYINEE